MVGSTTLLAIFIQSIIGVGGLGTTEKTTQ
jgi:hypothetical protein